MAERLTRTLLLLALLFACGYWIPALRSWEALDPLLLCGFAMLGALIAGPAASKPGASWRMAAGAGIAASCLVLMAVIATVNHVVKPPRLLLPPTPVLTRALVVAITGPLAFALLGRVLAVSPGGTLGAILLRAAFVGVAYAWWTLPATEVLYWFAIAAPVAAVAAGAFGHYRAALVNSTR